MSLSLLCRSQDILILIMYKIIIWWFYFIKSQHYITILNLCSSWISAKSLLDCVIIRTSWVLTLESSLYIIYSISNIFLGLEYSKISIKFLTCLYLNLSCNCFLVKKKKGQQKKASSRVSFFNINWFTWKKDKLVFF